MPKYISNVIDNNDSPMRRSSRARKKPVLSYKDDLPDNILNEVMKGVEPEVEMPEGWGASDDSEDDYKPIKDKNKLFKRRNRSDSSDEDDSDREDSPKRKGKVKSSKIEHKRKHKTSGKLKRKENDEHVHICLLCRVIGLYLESEVGEARYHYAECYYRNGAFWEDCPPGKENMWQVKSKKKAMDEFGDLVKYSCKLCSWGNMGYKEYCIHMALSHHLLEKNLEKDSSNDEMLHVLEKLDKRQKQEK